MYFGRLASNPAKLKWTRNITPVIPAVLNAVQSTNPLPSAEIVPVMTNDDSLHANTMTSLIIDVLTGKTQQNHQILLLQIQITAFTLLDVDVEPAIRSLSRAAVSRIAEIAEKSLLSRDEELLWLVEACVTFPALVLVLL